MRKLADLQTGRELGRAALVESVGEMGDGWPRRPGLSPL
jgi:hypothetical protein